MSRKEFHDHYSIEYLPPGASGSVKHKKSSLIISFLLLLALLLLGVFLWKQGYIDQLIQKNKVAEVQNQTTDVVDKTPQSKVLVSESNTTPKNDLMPVTKVSTPLKKTNRIDYTDRSGEEIFVDKCTYCHGKNGEGNLKEVYPKLQGQNSAYLLLQLKRMRDGKRLNVNPAMYKIISKMNDDTLGKIAAYISTIPNNNLDKENQQLLTNKLKDLTDQLSKEKERTTKLEKQLKKNLEISKNFSNLYKDAVNNIAQDDKAFLKIVKAEKMRLSQVSTVKSKDEQDSSDEVEQAVAVREVAKDDSNSLNSTVEISTTNQVDQIVSTINSISNKPLKNQPVSNKRVYVDLDNVAQKSVNIQNKINQLVSEKDVPNTSFTKALKTEEKVRKNAVRSVVVKKGETLWSIAKRAYGSGFKYPKILKANPRLRKGKNVRLYVGQVIRVPK